MNIYHTVLVVVAAGCVVQGVPVSENDVKSHEFSNEIIKSILKCYKDDGLDGIANCATKRVLRSIDIAAMQKKYEIIPGVTLVNNNPDGARLTKDLKEVKLPSDLAGKGEKFMELLISKTNNFFAGRSLEIIFPKSSGESISRAIEEGRGKMKKMYGPMVLGLGATLITLVPVMMAGLSLFSAKALIVGKLALVISLIIFVQYFYNGKNLLSSLTGHHNSHVHTTEYGGGYPYTVNSLGAWNNYVQEKYPYARSFAYKQDSKKQEKLYPGLSAYATHSQ